MKACAVEGTPWKQEFQHLLLSYCTSPHTTTNVAPCELLYNCTMKRQLPQITKQKCPNKHKIAKENIRQKKKSNKEYYDKHCRATESDTGELQIKTSMSTSTASKFVMGNSYLLCLICGFGPWERVQMESRRKWNLSKPNLNMAEYFDCICIFYAEDVLEDEEFIPLLKEIMRTALELPYWKFPRLNLADISEDECLTEFHFEKEDIPRLARALRLPPKFVCSN